MLHRKWRETKQQPSRARSGYQLSCFLVSVHFLCECGSKEAERVPRKEVYQFQFKIACKQERPLHHALLQTLNSRRKSLDGGILSTMSERVDEIKWRDIIKNWTPLDGAKSDRRSRRKAQIPEGIDCHHSRRSN